MLRELRCIIGQNLEILTSTGGEWSCGQAQNCVNFDFQVKFDLEGHGQSTPKTIGILTKLFCMSGSNLVILAGTSDKLSRGQARDWRPHGQTQATTIPEGQNWPRVKKAEKILPQNYRPISLTSIICKTMESIIHDAIINHMKSNKLFSPRQFEFITGRSTVLQLLHVLDIWSEILD